MTVKEIIKTGASLLGRGEIVSYLDSGEDTDNVILANVNLMTRLVNLVISELADSYVPMVKTEEIATDGGKIYFKDLSENFLSVKQITDTKGRKIDYKIYNEYILVSRTAVILEYNFAPSNYGLEDKIFYQEKDIPLRVIAYGVIAEFCITEGSFDEAVMWHKRYAESIEKLCLPTNKRVAQRGWV